MSLEKHASVRPARPPVRAQRVPRGPAPRSRRSSANIAISFTAKTDSERFFALITKEIEAHDGDVGEGIAAAARWVAEELPVYSLNCVLATPTDLWALRYPESSSAPRARAREWRQRAARGTLDAASPAGTVRVRSGALGTVAPR